MGLSASQARLLSITARLSDNELHSQLLTNAKLRLAAKTTEASDKYMDALSDTKLQIQSFDDNGNVDYDALTPNYLFTYGPLKNQYGLVDQNGKNLVKAVDAKTYENTGSLYDFLDSYGLIDSGVNDAAMAEYNKKMDDYNAAMEKYKKEKAKYDEEYADYQTKYQEWLDSTEPQSDIYTKFTDIVGTSESGGKDCYHNALNGRLECYI